MESGKNNTPAPGGWDGLHVSETDSYRRDHLIRVIGRSLERLTLKELEALSYDMFTKGYVEAADL